MGRHLKPLKRVFHRLTGTIILLSLAAGCGETPAPDDRELRIFSTAAAANHILLRLGAGSHLKAIDRYGSIVPGAAALPVIGQGSVVSREMLLELGINQAIVWFYQTDLQQRLEKQGINCLVLPPPRLADYPETVRSIARLAGKTPEAENLIAEFERQLPPPSPETDNRPRVYFELYSPGKTFGDASYLGDLLRAAGGENIAGELSRSGSISLERILERQPEIIFYIDGFTTAAEIAARPGFAALPAVRNRRLYPIDRLAVLEGVNPAAAAAVLRAKILAEE